MSTSLYKEYSNTLGFNFKIYSGANMTHNSIFTSKMLGFEMKKLSKFKRLFIRDKSKILYCNKTKRVGFTSDIDSGTIVKIFKLQGDEKNGKSNDNRAVSK